MTKRTAGIRHRRHEEPVLGSVLEVTGAVLAAVDQRLASIYAELGDLLVAAGARRERRLTPQDNAGPLHVDAIVEIRRRCGDGGKRIRPRMASLGWEAGDGARRSEGSFEQLITICTALELLQTFALIQDDVMDRSENRRGVSTLHRTRARAHQDYDALGDSDLFGDSVAVLVGDLALSEAARLAYTCSREVAAVWRLMTAELVEGQLLDIAHAADRRRDRATSRQIARLKSGRYTITRPLQLGAVIADADPALIDGLVAWGDLVGDAFALRDDILGVIGDPKRTGKPAGDDLLEGKPTALLVWAQELLPRHDQSLLDACNAGRLTRAQVLDLASAMRDAGVFERAEVEIRAISERADQVLQGLPLGSSVYAQLATVAHEVAWRDA